MGMGGDHLVAAVAGDEAERRHGDDVRAAEAEIFMGMIDEVAPLPDARELLVALRREGRPVVLASSARGEEVERYLDLLDARGIVDGWTTAEDVDRTKPEPDVIEAAKERLPGGAAAVVIGDTTWDCVAAGRAGLPAVAVLTGGIAECELRAAGAVAVHRGARDLIEHLGRPPLAAAA
jgi:HAD superfamily hydrolase (TIGR01549 family)